MKFTFDISDGRVVSSSGRDVLKGDNYRQFLRVIACHVASERKRLNRQRT